MFIFAEYTLWNIYMSVCLRSYSIIIVKLETRIQFTFRKLVGDRGNTVL